MSTKKTNATVNPATEKKAEVKKPVAEKKPVVAKPTLDRQSIIKGVQEMFKSDTTVDIVPDTTFQDEKTGVMRASGQPEYQYVHIFRKGTTKNCMQWYIKAKGSIFIIGTGLIEMIPDTDYFAKSQHKKGYWEILTTNDNAGKTLATLVSAYAELQKNRAEAAEKKVEEQKAKKAEQKKVKAEKPATKKPAKKVEKVAKKPVSL